MAKTADEMRKELAEYDARNLSFTYLCEIMLDGCKGYKQFSDEEIAEFYHDVIQS
jgi:hypothetical protein